MFVTNLLMLVLAGGPGPEPGCTGPLTRHAVVRCATAASPRLRADRVRVEIARGEANAARVILPYNPTLSVTAGQRWNTVGARAINVTGNLSQRIEIGGQRRKRREAADADVAARQAESEITEREIVAKALLAYFDVLAARREVEVIDRGVETAQRLREVAEARASAGLGVPLEEDLAAAEVAALRENAALARGRVRVAEASLASALGLDPAQKLPPVRGELKPFAVPAGLSAAAAGANARPEIARQQSQRDAAQARLKLLKRERIPSPMLSFFAQTDGFNERVLGGGISFPIPLPHPLGRTNKGRIEAERSRIRESEERIAAENRAVTLEATVAYHEFEARRDAASAYDPAARTSANHSLEDLHEQIEQGRLPVRDALLTQQALLRLLLRGIESEHALCRASVALLLAAGAPFDGGSR
jgi:cobalt-zinc-cadmium efflux system outer membrane protein